MSNINDLTLYVDIQRRRLIRDIFSDEDASLPSLVQGDGYNVKLHAVQIRPGRPVGQPYEFVPLPDAVFVGIGRVGDVPLTGTFTLTFGANTTDAISINATAAQVATAINALASIVSAGGVTVAGETGGPWQVAFSSVGSRDFFTANVDAVFPLGAFTDYRLRAGTASLTEIQLLVIDPQLATLAETFTNLPSAAGSVTKLQVGASGVPDIQRVTISQDAYAGGFSLDFDGESTGFIPHDADAAEIQSILESLSNIDVDDVRVTGSKPAWEISFIGLTGSQELMTIDVSGLSVPVGKQGLLTLATGGIELLVSGKSSDSATFEIQGIVSGNHATIFQSECTILNDGIPSSPVAAPTTPTLATQSEVTALANRVDDAEDDIAAAEADIIALDGRMDAAEADIDALEAAQYTNPLTTAGDIIIAGAAGVQQRLGIGADGTVLKSNGTTGSWAAQSTLTAGEATAALGLKTASTTVSVSSAVAPTNGQFLVASSSTAAAWVTPPAATFASPGALINLTISNNATDPTNDINVSPGIACSDNNEINIELASTIVKRLDATWAVGTNEGGLDTGTKATSTWYAVFLIRRPDTGVVDVIFSGSGNLSVMPDNYTQKRRIGWIYNNASDAIAPFDQRKDYFYFRTAAEDVSVSNLSTTRIDYTVTAPPNSIGLFSGQISHASASRFVIFSTPSSAVDDLPTNTLYTIRTNGASGAITGYNVELSVDGSRQIAARTNGSATSLQVQTRGWIDQRHSL
jgi:hypothetical protein